MVMDHRFPRSFLSSLGLPFLPSSHRARHRREDDEHPWIRAAASTSSNDGRSAAAAAAAADADPASHRSSSSPSPPQLAASATTAPSVVPTDQLVQHIRQRDWQAVRQRLTTHPADARRLDYKNNHGATPLHVALLHRAPHDVIKQLVSAYPQARLVQDSQGWTPLHVHILYDGGPHQQHETTLLLLEKVADTSAASLQSSTSSLIGSPLHLACRHGASARVLQALVQAAPHQVRRRNPAGMFPASLLYKHVARRQHNNGNGNLLNNHDDDDASQQCRRELWERIAILIQGAAASVDRHEHDANEFCLQTATDSQEFKVLSLHDIITFQHLYADEQTDLVSLVFSLVNGDNNMKNNINDNNNNHVTIDYRAWHTAASLPWKCSSSHNSSLKLGKRQLPNDQLVLLQKLLLSQQEQTQKDPLQLLVQHDPSLATVPNASGRLPLFTALQQGQRLWTTSFSSTPSSPSSLASLVQAAPETLACRDVETGLYAFQLAAAAAAAAAEDDNDNDNESDESTRNNTQRIETIWELLRACPHIIHSFSSGGGHRN